MAKPDLRIVPLGGLGEIGKNMTVFEYGTDAIIVDTGIMFPANDMHGIDYIIPDFQYLKDRKDLNILGIFYTHGHEDHIGAVSHVVSAFPKVPLYATPLTAGLIDVKLRDAKLAKTTQMNVFKAGDNIKVGPFTIESFHVCHSIPDCVGYGISTPHGLIVHTGDYKFDNTPVFGQKPDYGKLASFSQRGVLLLMADSTNSDREGWTPSEAVIDGAFDRVFRNAKGRIMVGTFASLLSRVQQVSRACQKYNRRLAIAGYTMNEYVKMALKLGYLDIPDRLFIDITKINSLQPHEICLMVTGTQGEPAAVLSRLGEGRHRQLDVRAGDTIVLSSHPIPGNEELVYRTINKLFQRGAEVIYDPIESVHVSGHARQEEMRLMMNIVNPKYMLPIHGELRHLKQHAALARQSGIPEKNIIVAENGMVINVNKNSVKIGERIPGGYIFVDGSGVGDVGRAVIRDREILARDGFLTISVNIDRAGEIHGNPDIISRGFVYLRDSDDLFQNVRNTVYDIISQNGNRSNRQIEDSLTEAVGKVLYNETKRRPMVFSIVNKFQ